MVTFLDNRYNPALKMVFGYYPEPWNFQKKIPGSVRVVEKNPGRVGQRVLVRPCPPPSYLKSYIAIFPKFMIEVSFIMAKIFNINFWIGNDPPPPSELFRNFIRDS